MSISSMTSVRAGPDCISAFGVQSFQEPETATGNEHFNIVMPAIGFFFSPLCAESTWSKTSVQIITNVMRIVGL